MFLKVLLVEISSIWKFDSNNNNNNNNNNNHFAKKVRSSWEFFRNWVLLLTFTIDSSVEIQDSYLDKRFQLTHAHFRLQFGLRDSTLALVLDDSFRLQFNLGGILDFKLQKSSTASVFAFGLWRVLWASLYAWLAEWRRHSWRAVTGCWRAPEPGADGQPPAAELL